MPPFSCLSCPGCRRGDFSACTATFCTPQTRTVLLRKRRGACAASKALPGKQRCEECIAQRRRARQLFKEGGGAAAGAEAEAAAAVAEEECKADRGSAEEECEEGPEGFLAGGRGGRAASGLQNLAWLRHVLPAACSTCWEALFDFLSLFLALFVCAGGLGAPM